MSRRRLAQGPAGCCGVVFDLPVAKSIVAWTVAGIGCFTTRLQVGEILNRGPVDTNSRLTIDTTDEFSALGTVMCRDFGAFPAALPRRTLLRTEP